jgi:hypothetical protein
MFRPALSRSDVVHKPWIVIVFTCVTGGFEFNLVTTQPTNFSYVEVQDGRANTSLNLDRSLMKHEVTTIESSCVGKVAYFFRLKKISSSGEIHRRNARTGKASLCHRMTHMWWEF